MRNLDPLFSSHKLRPEATTRVNAVKESFDDLLHTLRTLCPPGREFALVKTKLEEACFYAVKAVAIQQDQATIADSESPASRKGGHVG